MTASTNIRFSRVDLFSNPQNGIRAISTLSGPDSIEFERNSWVIIAPDSTIERTTVVAERRNRDPVSMDLGAYLGRHPKLEGMHCYAIDRSKGRKAPTSGRRGKNARSNRGSSRRPERSQTADSQQPSVTPQGSQAQLDGSVQPSIERVEQPQPAQLDGSDRADIMECIKTGDLATLKVMGRLVAEINGRIDTLDAVRSVEVRINDVAAGTVKAVKGLTHPCFNRMLELLANGIQAYLYGPSGSGKTHAAEQAADALGLAYTYNGSVVDRVEYLGFVDATGNYQRTPFRDAWENGGLHCFDEFDGSIPNEIMPLMAAFAGAESLPFPDGMVKRNADFRLVVTGNTAGAGADNLYSARYQLDAATLARFGMLAWGYCPAIERAMANGNIDWLRKVHAIRAIVEQHRIRHVVTPRAIAQGSCMLAAGWTEADCLEAFVYQGMSATDRAKVEGSVS